MKKSVAVLSVLVFALSLYGCATPYEKKVQKLQQEIAYRRLEIALSNLSLEYNAKKLDFDSKKKTIALENKKAELDLKASQEAAVVEAKKAEQALKQSKIDMSAKVLEMTSQRIDNEVKRSELKRKNDENRSVFITE